MSKREDARALLGEDPGRWAAVRVEQGYTWAWVTQELYEETRVSVQAKTLRKWSGTQG